MEVYLDNAATSHPKPDVVLEAVTRALTTDNGNPGRSGHRRALTGARTLLEGREALATLLGAADPFSIAYCFNCTDALNLAIKGCLHKGDHVISTLLEHNSVLRVLTELQVSGQIDLTLLRADAEGHVQPQHFERALRTNTRLAVITQASNVTGVLQPVAEIGRICRRSGVCFLIDGAQALGVFPTNVVSLNCDLYAFPGHKGLLGPQGTGGLYIRPGLLLHTLREGGTGSVSDSMRQPTEPPERYESGTVNLPGIAGLCAGTQYVFRSLGEIRAHETALTRQLLEGLAHIDGVTLYGSSKVDERVGVVSFNVGDYSSSDVTDALSESGFAVRGGLHCAPGVHQLLGTLNRGAVRASLGHANTPTEIDAFLAEIHRIAHKGVY